MRDLGWPGSLGQVHGIEVACKYLHLHRRGPVLLCETLTVSRLDPNDFVRIHRSTIVRISAIRELERLFAGDFLVRLHDGRELTLSRNHRKEFETAIGREL